MTKLKHITRSVIRNILNEGTAQDLKALDAIAKTALQMLADLTLPEKMPVVTDKQPHIEFEPIQIRFVIRTMDELKGWNVSEDFKAVFLNPLEVNPGVIRFVHSNKVRPTLRGYFKGGLYPEINLYLHTVPRSAWKWMRGDNFKRAVEKAFLDSRTLQHELQHLYEYLRRVEVRYGKGDERRSKEISNFYGEYAKTDAAVDIAAGKSNREYLKIYYTLYRAVPQEIWAFAVQEILPLLVDSPAENVLPLYYNSAHRDKAIRKYINTVLHIPLKTKLTRPGDASPDSIRRNLIKLFTKTLEDRMKDVVKESESNPRLKRMLQMYKDDYRSTPSPIKSSGQIVPTIKAFFRTFRKLLDR